MRLPTAGFVGADFEVEARRAVSAAYYAVFHLLAADGAAIIGGSSGLAGVQARTRRVFEHKQMRMVCEAFVSWQANGRPEGLGQIIGRSIDERLIRVATAFVSLQQARQAADYDLATTFALYDAVQLVDSAERAFRAWADVRATSDAAIFLTTLLLGERLYRRG